MTRLDRMLDDLQLGEFIYEQPAVGDIEYIFKHALTQEVAYNSVLMERRRQLARTHRCGDRESLRESIDDHLDELAHHYSRSGNSAKALEYLESAGLRAVRRLAYGEAMRNLTAALELLATHAIQRRAGPAGIRAPNQPWSRADGHQRVGGAGNRAGLSSR